MRSQPGIFMPVMGNERADLAAASALSLPGMLKRVGTGRATNFKFGRHIHKVHPTKSRLKIWEKKERGRIQWLHNFLSTPIISGTGRATNFKFGTLLYLQGPCEQKPIKNLWENGAWAYPGTAEIFQYPLLSQERQKLRTSNFVRTFLVSIWTKVHYKFWEK